MKYPKRVTVIELENAPFRNSDAADDWARTHGVIGLMSNVDPKAKDNQPTKAYSYEINNIEVLKGNAGVVPLPSDRTSMDVGILLNGVCDVNGVPLLKQKAEVKN